MFNKPKELIEYEEIIKRGYPACCHTCENFNEQNADCYAYKMKVPQEFIESVGQCEKWEHKIPF